nr:hypothetical protein [Tanacetum cinerariifolium]
GGEVHGRLAFIGRFNGPKGERAAALFEHVFPPLLREHAALRVALIGGELDHLPATGKAALGALQAEFGARVEQPGRVAPALQQRVRTDYDLGAIAARVLTVYESARMKKAVPGFIPVLMYHKIPDAPLASKHQIFVTKDNFAKHLAYFQQQKFTPITFLDYQAFASGRRPLAEFPRRPIILTFDDGYVDNYTNLLPLMQQAGYRGVLYLLGDFDVRYNYWDVDTNPTEPRSDI